MMASIGEVVAHKLAAAEPERPAPKLASVAELLQLGGVAVIVGGRTTNFTDAMRQHPQFVFWDSTDPHTQRRDLPANARVVLVTRFVSHALEQRVRSDAKRRGIASIPGLMSSGDVREHLQPVVDHVVPKREEPVTAFEALFDTSMRIMNPLLDVSGPKQAPAVPQEMEIPVSTPQVLRRPGMGELKAFIVKHMDRSSALEGPFDEARRLLSKLHDSGVTSTIDSVRQTMRKFLQDDVSGAMRENVEASVKRVIARHGKSLEKIGGVVDTTDRITPGFDRWAGTRSRG